MQIAYLDGRRLRRGLIAGSAMVRESARYLDSINVFPVPDGDTGTNMAATVGTVERAVRTLSMRSAARMLRDAADAALTGARGNSGAIMAQFIHGLAEEVREDVRLGGRAFAAAAHRAAERTWAAVSNPREGTILTVLRDWAASLKEKAEQCDDFLPAWSHALEAARRSLERTKELLPEARKAGVVDAGAGGFVRYLEGVDAFIAAGDMRAMETAGAETDSAAEWEAAVPVDLEGEAGAGFRYCVEAMLEDPSAGLSAQAVRSAVENLGDSLVLAGGGGRLRIHIHADDPPAVFTALAPFGAFASQKVDDMLVQRRLSAGKRRCVVVVDSTSDLPDELRAELLVPRVPVRVTVEGRELLDRDALRAADLAALLAAAPGTETSTSQPSHGDFLRVFSHAAAHTEDLVYLGLSGALSGTLAAGIRAGAEAAKKEGLAFHAVDTRSGSIGTALIARRCALAAAEGASGAEVAALAEELRSRLGLRFAVRSLDRLIRSGRLSRTAGLALNGLGVRPVLTVGEDGKIAKEGLFIGPRRVAAVLEKAVAGACAASGRIEDLAVTHVGEREAAQRLAEVLAARFSPERPVLVVDLSPAISVHVGKGAMGVAWIAAPRGSRP